MTEEEVLKAKEIVCSKIRDRKNKFDQDLELYTKAGINDDLIKKDTEVKKQMLSNLETEICVELDKLEENEQ